MQDFLNVTGIVGVALINRRIRPCFVKLDERLDSSQQLALSQGLMQVVGDTSEEFDTFEFYFAEERVWLHKLTNGVILLVLVDPRLEVATYQQHLARLQAEFAQDMYQVLSAFKQRAGIVSSSNRTLTRTLGTVPKPVGPPPPPAPPKPAQPYSKPTRALPQRSAVVASMNELSTYGTQYLGKMVVANYWRGSRPNVPVLQKFEIDRQGNIAHPEGNAPCPEVELQALQDWAKDYVERCSQVIRNLEGMIRQDCPQVYQLLLTKDKSSGQ